MNGLRLEHRSQLPLRQKERSMSESNFLCSAAVRPASGRASLLIALIRWVLVAAVVTAPIFLFGEGFEPKYLGRVAASNGLCALLCLGLLRLVKRGRANLAGALFVYGLLALVGVLAWVNGEAVHVNVVNFTLVVAIASAVAHPRDLLLAGALAALEMIAIAWDRPPGAASDKDLVELRFEAIVQFLPTFCVIVGVLWLTRCHAGAPKQAGAALSRDADSRPSSPVTKSAFSNCAHRSPGKAHKDPS